MPDASNVAQLRVPAKSETFKYKGEVITLTFLMDGEHKGKWEWRCVVTRTMKFSGYADNIDKARIAAKKEVDKLG